MNLRLPPAVVATVALLGSALAFAVACSGSGGSAQCRSNCAAANGCPSAAVQDCSTECADLATLNAAIDTATPDAGCDPTFDALMTCESGLGNACDPNACSAQAAAYQACATAYCTNAEQATGCSHFGF